MKFNIKTILLILVILLLGSNLAVVMNYTLHRHHEAKAAQKKIELPDRQFGRFFNDELNLDSDQQEKFREFRRHYNRSANQVLNEMQTIRSKMANTLNVVHPDRKELDRLADQLGQKHCELKKLTFDYYENMQKVLNEDQQQKMVTIFQAMLTETGDAKTPGAGRQGHQGQGHGRGQGGGWQTQTDTLQ